VATLIGAPTPQVGGTAPDSVQPSVGFTGQPGLAATQPSPKGVPKGLQHTRVAGRWLAPIKSFHDHVESGHECDADSCVILLNSGQLYCPACACVALGTAQQKTANAAITAVVVLFVM